MLKPLFLELDFLSLSPIIEEKESILLEMKKNSVFYAESELPFMCGLSKQNYF